MLDEKIGIDFPFFQNQLWDIFGEPDESGPFARDYLTTIDLIEFQEQLGHVTNLTHAQYFGFYGNYVLEGPIKKALRLLCDQGLAQELRTFDGCFNIRPMKSGRQPSVHSWALAIDVNAATNPFSKTRLITDMSEGFVRCFLDAGFEWGGLWHSCHDAMHFQLPWTGDWRQSSAPMKPVPFVGYSHAENLLAGAL